MSDSFTVGVTPRYIAASPYRQTVVTAVAGAAFYSKSATVSQAVHEEELPQNQSVTLTSGRWFCATASQVKLFISYIPDAQTDMATQAELNELTAGGVGALVGAEKARAEAAEGAEQQRAETAEALKQASLGFTPEDVSNKDTTGTLGTSDTKYPSQKAVKTYVETEKTRAEAAEAERTKGPASSTESHVAVFNGTGGKTLKDGGKTIAEFAGLNKAETEALIKEIASGALTEKEVEALIKKLAPTPTKEEIETVVKAETAGGALAGTYGRTSTVGTPKLRDVVSLLDFAETKHGDGTVDDTEVFTKAVAAIKAVGRGTLLVPPHRLNGELATWTVGSGGSVEAACVELCSNLTVSAYGAKFKALSTGTRTLFGSEPNQKPTNELTATNVRWFGGTFEGTGAEAVNQYVINGNRAQDWVVRDVRVTKWGTTNGTGVINFKDGQRIRVENTTILECCKTGGRNAINFQTSAFGSNLLPYTEISITGNTVTGGGAAPICVQLTELSEYVNTAPNRVIISGNITQTAGWAGIVLEIGGNPEAAKGHIAQVTIANNHARYTGENTGNRGAIQIVNDSGTPIESATVFSELSVVNNICESTRHGIQCEASYATLEGNQVTAAGNGIYCETASSAVNLSHVRVRGGFVKMADGSTSFGVRFKNVTDGSIDTDVSFATGTTGTAKGVTIEKCSRIDVAPKVSLSPNYGILIKESGSIYVKSGARVYNPSTNATVAAVRVEGVLTGNVFIEDAIARDDRGGSAKMKYGIDNASTEGGKVFSRKNTLLGWTSKAWNGTILEQIDDVVDETGANWRGQRREEWGTAAPVAGTYAVGDKVWNTAPSAGTPTAFWVCVTAGTPGTWVVK